MRLIITLLSLAFLLTNCTPSEAIECHSKFRKGDEITFVQNKEINGLVIRSKSYDCKLYLVSYFTKFGKNETDWFREMELEKIED